MKRGRRKITGVILSLMMVFTLIPAMSFADGDTASPASREYDRNKTGGLPYEVEFEDNYVPESVTCDGVVLEYGTDYRAVGGGHPSIIYMQSIWMETLAPGTHKLVFNMDDGKAYKADLVVPEFWELTLKASPDYAGYFNIGDDGDKYYVKKGTSVDLYAAGWKGYMLNELKIDGQVIDAEDGEELTFTPSADSTIEAAFGSSTAIGLESCTIDFGKAEPGYEQPAPKTVKIKNTGKDEVILTAPEFTNFTAGKLPEEALRPGETAEMTVQPKAGLQKGVYEETVNVYALRDEAEIMALSLRDEPEEEPLYDAEASLTVRFEVGETEKPVPPAVDPDDPSVEAEDAPATGDSSSMAVWIVLMAAALTGAVTVIRKRRA